TRRGRSGVCRWPDHQTEPRFMIMRVYVVAPCHAAASPLSVLTVMTKRSTRANGPMRETAVPSVPALRYHALYADIIGGVTTFFTMAYIVVVNPAILSTSGTGM